MNNLQLKLLLLCCMLLLGTAEAKADRLKLAVASNFSHAINALAEQFEKQTGHEVSVSFGSTGKLYAQIIHGAPFDAFFAADEKRPALLEQKRLAQPGSRFTYATGRLVLWSPDANRVNTGLEALSGSNFNHLAIANPGLAPYGRAAKEVLQGSRLWSDLQPRLVRGENIGQAFQFVKSGNAELGFVAYSQIEYPGQAAVGSRWEVPQSLYAPIRQQAVLLTDKPAAREFLSYVKQANARLMIRKFGYGTI